MSDLFLLDVEPCQPPPLTMARQRVEALQSRHDAILAEAEEARSELVRLERIALSPAPADRAAR